MAKYEYETIDGTQDGFVVGFGEIKDGKISSDTPIESPNLKLVNATVSSSVPVSGTASQQNPDQPETAGDSQQTNDQRVNLG